MKSNAKKPRSQRSLSRALAVAGATAVVAVLSTQGAAPANALYGQTDAQPGQFPYTTSFPWGCGGATVTDEWLVSAAHCIDNADNSDIGKEIEIGRTTWPTENSRFIVRTKILEVKHGPNTDLVLVRVEPRPGVATVPLTDQFAVGDVYTMPAAGTGSNSRLGSASFTITLKDLGATAVPSSTVASCLGDSGSPAVVHTPAGDRVIGVLSGIDNCDLGSNSYLTTLAGGEVAGRNWAWAQSVLGDITATSGKYRIVNQYTGKALELRDGKAVQATKSGSAAQTWTFKPHPEKTNLLDAKMVDIVNPATGQVLDVTGASQSNGTKIIGWPRSGDANQSWLFTPRADGAFTITSGWSGSLLGIPAGTDAVGEQAVQWSDTGAGDQKWVLERVS